MENSNLLLNAEIEVLFDANALYFWKLRFDPFLRSPLLMGRRNRIDYKMLVKTEGINSMNDVRDQIESNPKPMILIVEGDRGSGKTTAINYLFNMFYQSERYIETRRILPIFCGVDQLLVESALSIRKSFHASLLDAINKSILELQHRVVEFKSFDLSTSYEALEKENRFQIDNHIYEFLTVIGSFFEKIVILVDNFDKADPSKYNLFEEFFRGEQDFLESKILKNEASLLVTLQPFMSSRFKNEQELSYLGDKTINIQTWKKADLDEMIHRRLCLAFQGNPNRCVLEHFIGPSALEAIYTRMDYTPRFILIAVKHLMQKASDVSEEKNLPFAVRPISKAFCAVFLPEVQTNIQRNWFRIFASIDAFVLTNYGDAFHEIKSCIKENEDKAREILDALLSISLDKRTTDKDSVEILLRRKLIRPLRKDEYEITAKVGNLLSYLDKSLSQDKNQVRYYLLTKVF